MQDGISAVAPGRDYRLHSSLFGLLADGISVITTISKESIDLIVDQAEQRSKAVHIMRLSRRQHEARREPSGIAELAIMFVDIRQFTVLSETMTPRELSVLLSEYRPRVMAVIARHGVVVNKFIGDRVLVVFGLDSDPGAVAVSAIAAGHEALKTLEAWNSLRKSQHMDPIRVVVAIHASEVMIDNRGDQQRLEFSVLGAPVNKVSRIEAVAKENNVTLVISERILALAGNSADAGEWRSLGDLPLRGSSKQPRCSPFASWRSNRYRPVFRPRPVCGRSERWIAAHP